MAEHTPGPWGLEGTTKFGFAIRGTAPGRPIADNVTTLANAKLIAAAPTLLAFAKLVSDFFDNDSAGHAHYLKEQADTAIEEASS